jgi:hypothetical protein
MDILTLITGSHPHVRSTSICSKTQGAMAFQFNVQQLKT